MGAKPVYGVGLDAGSRVTRLVVCLLEQGRLRLLGCAAAVAEGWVKGRITDQRAVAGSITAALAEAEAAAGVSVITPAIVIRVRCSPRVWKFIFTW